MTDITTSDLFTALHRMIDEYDQMCMEVKTVRFALKEKQELLAAVEKERDALRDTLRSSKLGIPALDDGSGDYESAFLACIRAADKALKEFYKTRPPTTEEEKP